MSFKLSLNVGYFDRDSWRLQGRLDPDVVREVIVTSGGVLTEQSEDQQKRMIAAMMSRPVLGFIDHEFVVLHESGFLMVTIGYGSQRTMHRFLDCLCREHGCELLNGDDLTFVTDEMLEWLRTQSEDEPE